MYPGRHRTFQMVWGSLLVRRSGRHGQSPVSPACGSYGFMCWIWLVHPRIKYGHKRLASALMRGPEALTRCENDNFSVFFENTIYPILYVPEYRKLNLSLFFANPNYFRLTSIEFSSLSLPPSRNERICLLLSQFQGLIKHSGASLSLVAVALTGVGFNSSRLALGFHIQAPESHSCVGFSAFSVCLFPFAGSCLVCKTFSATSASFGKHRNMLAVLLGHSDLCVSLGASDSLEYK